MNRKMKYDFFTTFEIDFFVDTVYSYCKTDTNRR